jgi:hypothetical protein
VIRSLILAACLAVAISASAVAAPRVYYRVPMGDAVHKPKRIVFKDLTPSRIDWTGWGRRRATGTARARMNTCEPSCAAGRIVRGRATLKMFRRHREGRRRFYGCMTGRVRAAGETQRVLWPPGCD